MPVCETCRVAYLEGESHVCAGRPVSLRRLWRGFVAGGPAGRPRRLRSIVLAWAIALALTSPLVVLTGDLFGWETVLISVVAFPAGLLSLMPQSAQGAVESPLAKAVAGWMVYAGVSVAMLASREDGTYRRLFILLCILLGANVVGCYSPLLGAS